MTPPHKGLAQKCIHGWGMYACTCTFSWYTACTVPTLAECCAKNSSPSLTYSTVVCVSRVCVLCVCVHVCYSTPQPAHPWPELGKLNSWPQIGAFSHTILSLASNEVIIFTTYAPPSSGRPPNPWLLSYSSGQPSPTSMRGYHNASCSKSPQRVIAHLSLVSTPNTCTKRCMEEEGWINLIVVRYSPDTKFG